MFFFCFLVVNIQLFEIAQYALITSLFCTGKMADACHILHTPDSETIYT